MWRIKTTKDGVWLGRWILHSATQFHPFSTLPWDDQYPLFPGMTNTLYTIAPLIKVSERGKKRWSRFFEQNFRVAKWNLCRGYAAARSGSSVK